MAQSIRSRAVRKISNEFGISKEQAWNVVQLAMSLRGWPGHGYSKESLYEAAFDALGGAGLRPVESHQTREDGVRFSEDMWNVIQTASQKTSAREDVVEAIVMDLCKEDDLNPKTYSFSSGSHMKVCLDEVVHRAKQKVSMNQDQGEFSKPIQRVIQQLCVETSHHYDDVLRAVKSVCESWRINMKTEILNPGSEQRLHRLASAFLQTLVVSPPRKYSDDLLDLTDEPDYKWMWNQLEMHLEDLMTMLDNGYSPTQEGTFSRFALMRSRVSDIKKRAIESAKLDKERARFKWLIGDIIRGKKNPHYKFKGVHEEGPDTCFVDYGSNSGQHFELSRNEAITLVGEIVAEWIKELTNDGGPK
jgi:hypothetical protein